MLKAQKKNTFLINLNGNSKSGKFIILCNI